MAAMFSCACGKIASAQIGARNHIML